jgi:hypothetical protein
MIKGRTPEYWILRYDAVMSEFVIRRHIGNGLVAIEFVSGQLFCDPGILKTTTAVANHVIRIVGIINPVEGK